MSVNPYIAEIMPFASNFAVRGWALCNGQLMSISQNSALFSLLGTTFGGDGRTTFGLPDLRGRSIVHLGSGPGLDHISWGERGGSYYNILSSLNLPSHSHSISGAPAVSLKVTAEDGEDNSPIGNILSKSVSSTGQSDIYAGDTSTNVGQLDGVSASAGTLSAVNSGASQSFDIRDPYLGINMEIALIGVYPSRS
mmetsp:Transcript_36798/g.48307  ORF Transcript_36798/g.48307 Transcript_36798/m.48307 type:complete len:195 (+) Transcript_36798:102-686(+)